MGNAPFCTMITLGYDVEQGLKKDGGRHIRETGGCTESGCQTFVCDKTNGTTRTYPLLASLAFDTRHRVVDLPAHGVDGSAGPKFDKHRRRPAERRCLGMIR